jgi:Uma2 family endonuclease
MLRHATVSRLRGAHTAMAMPDTLDRWSLAELHRLPDDGNRYELVRGRLFVTPAPSYAHQCLVDDLAAALFPYVARHGLGRISFPRGVVRVGMDTEVEPDLMVRPHSGGRPRTWETAPLPLLVIEVLSGTTRRRDRVDKRSLYRDLGIPDYWIVDGERRIVRVVRPDAEDVDVSTVLTWQPRDILEPFELELSEFFRAALGG